MLVDPFALLRMQVVRELAAGARAFAALAHIVVAHVQPETPFAETAAGSRVVRATHTRVALAHEPELLREAPVGRERELREERLVDPVAERTPVARLAVASDQVHRTHVQVLAVRALPAAAALVHDADTRKPKHVHLRSEQRMTSINKCSLVYARSSAITQQY